MAISFRNYKSLLFVPYLLLLFLTASPLIVYAQSSGSAPRPPDLIQNMPGRHSLRHQAVKKAQALQAQSTLPSRSKCYPATCDELLTKAQQRGSVNVIILLNVPNLPDESRVPKKDRDNVMQARKAAIAQVQDRFLQRMSSHKVRVGAKFKLTPGLGITIDAKGLKDVMAQPEVKNIQENLPERTMLPQSIPLIGANQAWVNGFTGSGYTIAILDTGVDSSHPFLAGKVIAEACFSGTVQGSVSLCPNGQTAQIGSGAAAHCGLSGCEHGTHVAGIAAGTGSSFSGVAKGANIMPVQVFSRIDNAVTCASIGLSAPCIASFPQDQISALDEVRSLNAVNNIIAVNISIGGGTFTNFCDTDSRKPSIDALRNLGVATIVASGNSGYIDALSAPACISTAISVGATTKSDLVASYSNSAFFLNLLAPGGDGSGGANDIYSSVPSAGFDYKAGTSMAAPHVAGAFAVLKSQSPTANVSDTLSILRDSGVPITDTRNNITTPRIRLDNMPWVARYNGDANVTDTAAGIGLDSIGNTYVTGASCVVDTTCNFIDYVTLKYDSMGKQVWLARYHQGNFPQAASVQAQAVDIQVDANGNSYVTGTENITEWDPITGNTSSTLTGNSFVTTKYNNTGSPVWISRHINSTYSKAFAVGIDQLGNVYVSGTSCNTPLLPQTCASPDFLTIKYDQNGNEVWERRYSASRFVAMAMAVAPSGNVYIAGTIIGCTNNCILFATIKYDTNGNQLWANTFGSGGSVWIPSLTIDKIENVYVVGSERSFYSIVKYDTNGNQIWAVNDADTLETDSAAITVDDSGNVYMTGLKLGDDISTDSDYFTAKFDVNGNKVWVQRYVNLGYDEPTRIALDSIGNVYVTGFGCNAAAGEVLDSCRGVSDIRTLKYDNAGNLLKVIGHTIGANIYSVTFYAANWNPSIAVDSLDNIHLTGWACQDDSCTNADYVTLKYNK
jgi:subtilisin